MDKTITSSYKTTTVSFPALFAQHERGWDKANLRLTLNDG